MFPDTHPRRCIRFALFFRPKRKLNEELEGVRESHRRPTWMRVCATRHRRAHAQRHAQRGQRPPAAGRRGDVAPGAPRRTRAEAMCTGEPHVRRTRTRRAACRPAVPPCFGQRAAPRPTALYTLVLPRLVGPAFRLMQAGTASSALSETYVQVVKARHDEFSFAQGR